MSKPRRYQNYKGPKVTDTKQKEKEKEKSNKRVWKIPYFPLLFIAFHNLRRRILHVAANKFFCVGQHHNVQRT